MENNYIKLAYELTKVFVSDEALLSIKQLESVEYDYHLLILVSEEDMKKVIGHKGKNVNSIINIMKAYAYKNNKKIKIEFESF